ncbi:MAG: AAA family ATPase [Bacteroidales bacterium]|nr:AAA family ATPase [Bacteroidales bacterium]
MELDTNKPFGKYHLDSLIKESQGTNVYEAYDCDNNTYHITIHDNEYYEQKGKTAALKEAEVISQLSDNVFLKLVDGGTVEREGKKYSYFCHIYENHMTLREIMGYNDTLDEDYSVNIVKDVLRGLVELSGLMNGGGHYNICPDNVFVDHYDGKAVPFIIGLEHASEPCNGNPDFVCEDIDIRYRAPETFWGRFNSASDVYSVGVMLYEMIFNGLPYPVDETMDAKAALNAIKTADTPEVDVNSSYLKHIISKAIKRNVGARYENVGEFYNAVVDYLANKDNREKQIKNEDMSDNAQAVNEPKLNVKMSVKTGEGLMAVAGMTELKRQLRRDFVDIVTHPELADEFSIQPPNMLLFGPPGTGKTYLGERLSEEVGMDCCSIKPSDLGSIWIHGSQSLIKELFAKAEAKAKKNKRGCLLLIDEIDAFCCKRDASGNETMANEVAEWLTQLNECVSKKVYVIGMTNSIQRIDPAILRHGRIDKIVYIGLPDKECRKQLFEYELNKRPHACDINIDNLADLTEGFTSSDIAYIVKASATSAFEASIKEEDEVLKIDEEMLLNIIKTTRPSVTQQEARRYEKTRDEFLNVKHNERRPIGFYA